MLILMCICVLPGTLKAQNPAKEAYVEAESLASIGKYKEAVEKYEEAYRLAPRSVLLFHIAHTYELWEKYDDALEWYHRYLDIASRAEEERELAEGRILGIKEKLAKTGIFIDYKKEGATVFIDRKEAGTTPLEKILGVKPGPHKIEVKKQGLESYHTTVHVHAGTVESIRPVLITSIVPPPPPPPPPSPPSHTLEYVFFGVGSAAVLGGASMGIWYAADEDAPDAALYSMHGLIWPGLAVIITGAVIYGINQEEYEKELQLYRIRYGKVVVAPPGRTP